MSEYTLYIATVLLVLASIVFSKVNFDTPDENSAYPVAVIQHANEDRFFPE